MPHLLDLSQTFPEPIKNETKFDSEMRRIQRSFTDDRESIVLIGPSGSGKTTHLMQFAREFPTRCFTYFFSDSYWVWNQHSMLSSLCQQMSAALGIQRTSGLLDLDRTKTLFGSLTQKVIDLARREKNSFYFVIDGLDYADRGTPGEKSIEIFPLPVHPRYLYFLGSIRTESKHLLSFSYRPLEPRLFSEADTRSYLADFDLPDGSIVRLHRDSNGIPGYLDEVRRLLIQGVTLENILKNPVGIETLTQMQWQRSRVEDDQNKIDTVGLAAFSLVALTGHQIALILSLSDKTVTDSLDGTGLVRTNGSGGYEFHSEFLHSAAQEKLQKHKDRLLAQLIRYYEHLQDSREAVVLLPKYYFQTENYAGLMEMIQPLRLVAAVEAYRDLNVCKRSLRQAALMASNAEDMPGTLNSSLAAAALGTLSHKLIGESEVAALVALKRFDEALQMAQSATLTETRVLLLSRVYQEKERGGQYVSRESIHAVERMLKDISQELEPDRAAELAAAVFPLLPDAANALLESARMRETSTHATDLAVAMVSSELNGRSYEQLLDQIQDVSLREMVFSITPWLSEQTAEAVRNRAQLMKQARAKEYLLRNWCLKNRHSPNIHLVLDAALDAVLEMPPASVPLRNLRQLSEALRNCAPAYRRDLARRFDIPNLIGLRSPIDERLRLELNLAEALFDVSEKEGMDRFLQAQASLDFDNMDLDLACYCRVRLFVTLARLDPNDNLKLQVQLVDQIEVTFGELLQASAEQHVITRRILRALTSVRPQMAFDLTARLNTFARREQGLHEAIVAYVAQKRLPVQFNLIKSALEGLKSVENHDRCVRDVIEEISSGDAPSRIALLHAMQGIARTIEDPITRCESLALLMSAFADPVETEGLRAVFDEVINAWNSVEVVWQRIELAFQIVVEIAKTDPEKAADLYERARTLRDTSSLATQPIGGMFYQLLQLAVRVAASIDPSKPNDNSIWPVLLANIQNVPSSLLRTQLFARLALGRLRKGDKKTFDRLMQAEVVPGLRNAIQSNLKNQITVAVTAAVFEYSPSEARRLISRLPPDQQNAAWATAAMITLSNANIGDPLDVEFPNNTIDLARADKTLALLDNVNEDGALHSAIELFCKQLENRETQLQEGQKIDILNRLETLANDKLPDRSNIQHPGYLLLCRSVIEKARVNCTRRKGELKRRHSHIIQESRHLTNVAGPCFWF